MIYKNFCRFKLLIGSTMHRFRLFLALWAGIVFFGGTVYAQEKNIDTLHIFKADTVRLGFDDVLQLSAVYDSVDREDWHYIYRWNTGERTDAIQVKFNGQRKVLYTGQRFSAIHWPGEFDTLLFHAGDNYRNCYYYCINPKDDTVILRAPDVEGAEVRYEWSNGSYFVEERLIPDTEQYAVVYWGMGKQLGWEYGASWEYSCRITAISDEGEPTILYSTLGVFFVPDESGFVQTPQGRQVHDYNVWSMPEWTQIYARLGDTLHFFSEMDYDVYPDYAYIADLKFIENIWYIYPCRFYIDDIHDS
ncbi:MAG: hypothetical protein K2H68_00675, partial [Bacteroidales bacterium]|nr:hypothetical protein [Bacteroidales bacterium]